MNRTKLASFLCTIVLLSTAIIPTSATVLAMKDEKAGGSLLEPLIKKAPNRAHTDANIGPHTDLENPPLPPLPSEALRNARWYNHLGCKILGATAGVVALIGGAYLFIQLFPH
jgi:hypothetical protein